MEEEYRSCDNCYYTYFDEKAYPCSLCIRGVERTEKWMAKVVTDQTERSE